MERYECGEKREKYKRRCDEERREKRDEFEEVRREEDQVTEVQWMGENQGANHSKVRRIDDVLLRRLGSGGIFISHCFKWGKKRREFG